MKVKIYLDRIEEGKAVFLTDTKKQLIIDSDLFEEKLKEGQVFWLDFSVDEKEAEDKSELAKKILNEIISDN
ncbi:MAG TPA: DUF3006 family protein [Candidatus Bipolaricaulota bacterium]|nr:DUF3006 family protein [Candidatus Bipolaricaulota bacterium]